MHTIDLTSLGTHHIILLAVSALFGGFIDAIVGGGGFFLITAFFFLSMDPSYAIGTYKIIAFVGTLPILYRVHKSHLVFDMEAPKWAFLVAIPFSISGILLVKYFAADTIKNIIAVFALIMLTYKLIDRPDVVLNKGKPLMSSTYFHIIFVPIIMTYDSFLGIGSTIMLMTGYLVIMKSTTNSALWSSRLLVYMSEFISSVTILYNMLFDLKLGLYLLPIYAIGNDIGVRLSIKIGPKFINILVLVSLSIMAIYSLCERYYGFSI